MRQRKADSSTDQRALDQSLLGPHIALIAFIPMNVLQWAPFSAGSSLVKIAGQSAFDPALAMPLAATTAYVSLARSWRRPSSLADPRSPDRADGLLPAGSRSHSLVPDL